MHYLITQVKAMAYRNLRQGEREGAVSIEEKWLFLYLY